MTYKEDDDLVVAGTCDAKVLEDAFTFSRQALDKATALLKTDARDLQGSSKLMVIYLDNKAAYTAYAQDLAAGPQKDENLIKNIDTTPGYGAFLCLDPAYKLNQGNSNARFHMTLHTLGHQTMNNYAAHHGGAPIPGWIFEGFAAWLDGSVLASPGIWCSVNVDYQDGQHGNRDTTVNWDRVAFQVLKDYKDGKTDPKTGKPAYTRLGNLMGVKRANLTGPDVAVSWCLMKEMAVKPGEFKAFLDAILAGTKQTEAFQAAFKKSVDDYEKDWIKAFLKKPPAEAKPRP